MSCCPPVTSRRVRSDDTVLRSAESSVGRDRIRGEQLHFSVRFIGACTSNASRAGHAARYVRLVNAVQFLLSIRSPRRPEQGNGTEIQFRFDGSRNRPRGTREKYFRITLPRGKKPWRSTAVLSRSFFKRCPRRFTWAQSVSQRVRFHCSALLTLLINYMKNRGVGIHRYTRYAREIAYCTSFRRGAGSGGLGQSVRVKH